MKYISTKELANLWGISKRRVVELASQGRIDGAEFIGGAWLFPEDATKPTDPRKNKSLKNEDPNEKYIFPFIIACVHSKEQVENFTEEEKALYHMCLTYESGDLLKAKEEAEKLIQSSNRYIRIGALYHMPVILMYLQEFDEIQKYYILFRTEIDNAPAHKNELNLIVDALDSELFDVPTDAIIDAMRNIDLYPDELIPSIVVWYLLSEAANLGSDKPALDISLYEANCRLIEAQGYFFYSIFMHAYLSLYYGALGESVKASLHAKKALDIALEHDTVFTMAFTASYDLEMSSCLISDYPSEVIERFKHFAHIYMGSRNAYAQYMGKSNILSRIDWDDYKLISCCLKDYSIEKMAELFGLSRSGMNKRLSHLYSKLEVGSKNELKKAYLSTIFVQE